MSMCMDCLKYNTKDCSHPEWAAIHEPDPRCYLNDYQCEFGEGSDDETPLFDTFEDNTMRTWFCLRCKIYVSGPTNKCPYCHTIKGRGTMHKELMV